MRTEKLAYIDEVAVADGRTPVEQLLATIDTLALQHGNVWQKKIVTTQLDYNIDPYRPRRLPIVNYTTKHTGPALWLLAGIHGEEPAGPMAIAQKIETIHALARLGVPIVLFGLCNPLGYHNNTRHPNPEIEATVTEADHLMVHLTDPTRARISHAATPESACINGRVYELHSLYPPLFALDLHEDEPDDYNTDQTATERYSTYLFVISKLKNQYSDPVAQMIVNIWRTHGIPLWPNGFADKDERIEDGMVTIQPGEGSIGELLSLESCVIDGKVVGKHGAGVVITTETPTRRQAKQGSLDRSEVIPLIERVAAHGHVLDKLPHLWQAAKKTHL